LLDILMTSSTIKTTHIPRQETINLDGIIHWKPELTTMNIQLQAYTTCSGIRSHKIL
jgi:ABC-type amino acid transport system permease subunit